jgi:glycosyltransferase involved in cell wall biosynthesis
MSTKDITFTVVVPTQGRKTLVRCLESMLPQHHDSVRPEIIIVHDTYEVILDYYSTEDIRDLCARYGAKYLSYNAHTSNWGYPQLNVGYLAASGDYILNIGDDDIYEKGAFALIQQILSSAEYVHPHMFQAILHPSPHRGNLSPVVLWEKPELIRSRVTGQNFACPNRLGRVGFWWDDFCQMEATINLWHGEVTWVNKIIAQCY